MPNIPLVIVPEKTNWKDIQEKIETTLNKTFSHPKLWVQPQTAMIASRELYHKMRSFETEGADIILCVQNSQFYEEDWKGIWNRLDKAKTLTLV